MTSAKQSTQRKDRFLDHLFCPPAIICLFWWASCYESYPNHRNASKRAFAGVCNLVQCAPICSNLFLWGVGGTTTEVLIFPAYSGMPRKRGAASFLFGSCLSLYIRQEETSGRFGMFRLPFTLHAAVCHFWLSLQVNQHRPTTLVRSWPHLRSILL